MSQEKMGTSAIKQLYVNFLYRIILIKRMYGLTNLNLFIFTPQGLLSMPSFKEFRTIFLKEFQFIKGFSMPLEEFSNTGKGLILLSLWRCGETEKKDLFYFTDKILDNDHVVDVADFSIYNCDYSNHIRNYISIEEESCKKIDLPNILSKSPFSLNGITKIRPDFIFTLFAADGTSVWRKYFVTLSNMPFHSGSIILTKSNFYNGVIYFSSRILPEITKYNSVHEFMCPIENDEFTQFKYDSIIYSMFNDRNKCFSYRNLNYQNKIWNVKNEFFFLSNQFIQDLANQYNFTELYQDTKIFNQERFVNIEIQKIMNKLSPDALEVLNKATELVIRSFPDRIKLNFLKPEWNLSSWDASWYQISLVLKETMKEDLNNFKELYKKFEVRMREGVYKFGFLK